MTIKITIEDKESFEWLARLIDNTLSSPNSPVMVNSYMHVQAWHDALTNAEIIKTVDPKPKKRSQHKPQDPDPFSCKEHPKYEGKRVPRTNCDDCWEIYGKFHPMEFKQKRAAFMRKLSKQ